ncbi:MAG: transglutaminase-like cysteine peptidase [Woeseiaceae bacterium]|nr:transglutaminase-like cysteine peptidase [Woeseiaceae bacterium]
MRHRLEVVLAMMVTMFASTHAHGQTLYSFDTAEDFFAPAASWAAWQDTLDRHRSEREALRQCLASEDSCARRFKSLRHILVKGAHLEREQQIRLVNRYVNRQRYEDDRISSRSGAGNQWETLAEFLHSGGDCEDFAAAKYFILREFGVGAADMRIVVGKERQRATHHAMLAIRIGEDVWLLENDNTIRRNGSQDINEFVYAINELGIWDHEKED